ncbi:hypothetical protein DFJ63DRAFT_315080 [Scheffersomyces coipomensis]|uniref:uncharacterized protein n=1 Tax=Scheffersomyces coipomensis TaxID=1788519 RepID=UPI00315D9D8F
MSSFFELINCDKFIEFFKKNHDKKINLFKVSSDAAVSQSYFEGLSKLEYILKEFNINDNSEFSKEVKFLLNRFMPLQYPARQILITLYKACNSHFFFSDFTSDDVTIVTYVSDLYEEIIGVFQTIEDYNERVNLKNFKKYTLSMKYLTVKWEIKSIETKTNSPFSPISLTNSSMSERLDFNNTAEGYNVKNTFFDENGYFFPQLDSQPYSSFVKENLDLLNIVPDDVGSIKISDVSTIVASEKTEDKVEKQISLLLTNSIQLFKSNNISYDNQKTQHLKGTKYKSRPDILIYMKNLVVPIEVKRNQIKEIFQAFEISKSKTNLGSREFINVFSQSLLQSLSCCSNISFITDGNFAIAIIFEDYDFISYNVSKLYKTPCQIIVFDSESERVSVPVFIIMVILKYSKIVEESKVLNFVESLNFTEDQKSQLWKDRYDMLYSFNDLILKVPESITVDIRRGNLRTSAISDQRDHSQVSSATDQVSSATDSSVDDEIDIHTISEYIQGGEEEIDNELEDIEGDMEDEINDDEMNDNYSVRFQDSELKDIKKVEKEVLKKLNINVSLKSFYILKNNMDMETLDISSIGSYTIISGESPQKNYSIVIKTGDDKIYKIFDPVLCQIDSSGSSVSFQDQMAFTFKAFVRDALTHVYLNDSFMYKPRCYSIGFLINKERETCSDTESVNSMSGFFIKMSLSEGQILSRINFNDSVKKELWNVIDTLHGLGVSHGDVHSSNFLYDTGTNSMMILDFGRSYQAYLRGNAGYEKKGTSISELEKRIEFDQQNTESMILKLTHGPRSYFPSLR